MEPNNASTETENGGAAKIVVVLQLIVWGIALSTFVTDFMGGSDPAGNGMARGISLVFVTIPSMVFIFLGNLYLLHKIDLSKIYGYIAITNFIGLIILALNINW